MKIQSDRGSKWNCQEKKIKSNGHVLFLDIGSGLARKLQYKMGTSCGKHGSYATKHHPIEHLRRVSLYCMHQKNSPIYLPRALPPSVLQGCVDTATRGYGGKSPLSPISRARMLLRHQNTWMMGRPHLNKQTTDRPCR